jgi:hypothetical protein
LKEGIGGESTGDKGVKQRVILQITLILLSPGKGKEFS